MSRTVTRGSSCNYPFRYFGHKQYLAQMAERKVWPLADVIADEFAAAQDDGFVPEADVIELQGALLDIELEFARDDDQMCWRYEVTRGGCSCSCNRCLFHDDHAWCDSPDCFPSTGVFHADNTNPEGGFFA